QKVDGVQEQRQSFVGHDATEERQPYGFPFLRGGADCGTAVVEIGMEQREQSRAWYLACNGQTAGYRRAQGEHDIGLADGPVEQVINRVGAVVAGVALGVVDEGGIAYSSSLPRWQHQRRQDVRHQLDHRLYSAGRDLAHEMPLQKRNAPGFAEGPKIGS